MIERKRVERRLAERKLECRWVGTPPDRFSSFVVDSRRVEPGSLFCAVRGTAADGHDFLAAAAGAGAAAAVVEEPDRSVRLPQVVVTDTRAAAAHLASLFLGDPARDLLLVGITGTNGKTTTALLLRHLLGERQAAGALGTLGVVPPSGPSRPGNLTTPGPVELMEALAELGREGARAVTLEVSSHALDQRRVAALRFAAAVFTNLTRDHLDYHADLAAYRKAKLRLAAAVEPEGVCVVNADEPNWHGADFGGRRIVWYGCGSAAEVGAEDVRLDAEGSHWILRAAGVRCPVRLPLVGGFNVSNALGAAAAAIALGMAPAAAARRLATAPQVPGRMEVLARRPAVIVRDYAHTPDALARALEALRPLARGRLIAVFGCGGDRDRGKRPEMGRIAAERADLSVVTSDNPRSEDPGRIIREIEAGMGDAVRHVIPDRREAIRRALSTADAEDVVLLAGKGHEEYQEIRGERLPFDEGRIVAELLGAAEGG